VLQSQASPTHLHRHRGHAATGQPGVATRPATRRLQRRCTDAQVLQGHCSSVITQRGNSSNSWCGKARKRIRVVSGFLRSTLVGFARNPLSREMVAEKRAGRASETAPAGGTQSGRQAIARARLSLLIATFLPLFAGQLGQGQPFHIPALVLHQTRRDFSSPPMRLEAYARGMGSIQGASDRRWSRKTTEAGRRGHQSGERARPHDQQ